MAGPYSALTKTELPNGDLLIKDTINGTQHRYTKEEWANPGIDKGLNDGPKSEKGNDKDHRSKKGR